MKSSDRDKKAKERELIEGLRPICICRGIKQRVLLEKIRSGSRTVEELQKATGAGNGSCKGERCIPRIKELLKRQR